MPPPDRNTLVLIDGHSNVHKAYHAIGQPLTNADGEPTQAIYGFLNMFFRLLREIDFRHVAVVFDPPGPSFRKEVFEAYKANREASPDDLIAQYHRIREVLDILGVPIMEVPGFEADDVLGALAMRAVETGGEALVCSVDKDLLQVVRPGIRVWRDHLQKVEVLDEQGVTDKMGVRPDQVPAYLGLLGDTSDNIPGVAGVGQKTAVALLQHYGTLEAILEATEPDPELTLRGAKKILEKVHAAADTARLSRDLATLRTDAVAEFDWPQFEWSFRPTPELREFYKRMNFRSLLESLGGETVAERTVDYAILRTRPELETAAAAIRQSGLCSIDTETDDLDPLTARLVGISLSWQPNQGVYIPLGHETDDAQASLEDVRQLLGPLLADPAIRWVAHHWNFDYKILREAGFPVGAIAGDTLLAAFLLNPDRSAGTLRLKDLALAHLDIRMTEIDELIGDGTDLVTMSGVTIDKVGEYACQDADCTRQLHEHLRPRVADANMDRLYDQVEVPLVPILAEMELEGVAIDREHFARLSKEATAELERLTKEIHELAGREFKINSPKQVADLLFNELGLTKGKKGKTGYSTDVSVLENLKHEHPLPARLLDYRQVEKLKSTYLDPLPSLIHPRTGRVHTSFNQTVAATGRLSSSNPNLQNIPVRTEAGRRIREGFVSRGPGWKLLAADYSQIELRILAHLSGDEALTHAFISGGDIHTLTASKVFNLPETDVTKQQRTAAKAINFGIIYGMTAFRLARDLEISRAKADQFIEDYFAVYSGVRTFIEETKAQARKDKYVTTLLGRRRPVPDMDARNPNARSLAERIAVNTPIQGTSADLIKIAMIRVDQRLRRENLAARLILQVHDELIFDVPEDEIDPLRKIAVEEMSTALEFAVPLRVDVAVGDNWAEC